MLPKASKLINLEKALYHCFLSAHILPVIARGRKNWLADLVKRGLACWKSRTFLLKIKEAQWGLNKDLLWKWLQLKNWTGAFASKRYIQSQNQKNFDKLHTKLRKVKDYCNNFWNWPKFPAKGNRVSSFNCLLISQHQRKAPTLQRKVRNLRTINALWHQMPGWCLVQVRTLHIMTSLLTTTKWIKCGI